LVNVLITVSVTREFETTTVGGSSSIMDSLVQVGTS
jgi:hypothetical protein